MKKPVVDYREFRFSRLREPRFSHLLYLWGWFVYFALYIITEKFVPAGECHVIYSPLDDMLPFTEIFVLPYVFWYGLLAFTVVWFALYSPENFKRFQVFIIVVQLVAMAIYILYPSRQDLRPEAFPRENFCTDIVRWLYSIDTSTNVCPSTHVGFSLGMISVWLKEKSAWLPWRIFILVICITICLATAFIKQHSVVDAFVAVPVCLLAEIIAYGKSYWLPQLKKLFAK